jgi:hypothetical protein
MNAFVDVPTPSADVQRLYDHDVEQVGFVMNLSAIWGHQPILHTGLFDLIALAVKAGGLSFRQRGVLITALASTMRDSYCSLAWGNRLAGVAGAELAGAIISGDDPLDPQEQALAKWARQVARDPNETKDVQTLRDNGYDDAQIVAITVFVALRIAFSTVNDALGARPDRELANAAPQEVRGAVTFGRAVA